MKIGFYIRTALRNIWHGKRQSSIYILGLTLSITLLISFNHWSSTAEELAALDFLQSQDYEMKLTTYLPEQLPEMRAWLENDPAVQSTDFVRYNLAFYNAENKPLSYRWSPENQQEDMSDPISLSTATFCTKNFLSRIKSQFKIRGEWDIDVGEVLISQFQAEQLAKVYGQPLEPGMTINVSMARRGPERGEVFLYHLGLKHFYNVTVKGIYQLIPNISMLQEVFSNDFLKDSTFFLIDNFEEADINQMEGNGLFPILMAKFEPQEVSKKGINEILNEINSVNDRLKIAFTSSQTIILDNPILELQNSYSFARTAIIFMAPVIIMGAFLALFTTNIVIEKRKEEIEIYKERGSQKWQIIGIILVEFVILSIFAIFFSILTSFIVASIIPTFASGEFSWEAFTNFMSELAFQYADTFYISLVAVIIPIIFAIFKMNKILSSDLEERQLLVRERLEKWTILSISIVSIISLIVLIIVRGVALYSDIKNSYNYNGNQTRISSQILLYIILLIMLLAILSTIGLNHLLGKIKFLYRRIIFNNSFFVTTNFKRAKYKLNSLLIIFIMIFSSTFFSMSLLKTLNINQEEETYYNNGSDLRIHTTYIHHSIAENFSEVEGVSEIMPVFKATGKMVYSEVTVYGVEPIKYGRIGRWKSTSFSDYDATYALNSLNMTDDGIIVSNNLAEKLNLTIDSRITVNELPNSSYINYFYVKAIMHSAPGFGLAYGPNLELNQPNEEFVIINARKMLRDFAVDSTDLFFGRVNPLYSIEEVKDKILEFTDVISVNPESINQQFVKQYIQRYIPGTNAFILAQIVLVTVIGILTIGTNVEFILNQRKKYIAILSSLGNTPQNMGKIILSELFILNFFSFIIGLIFGLPLAALSIFLIKPIFTSHIIIPFHFTVNYLGIAIFIASIYVLTTLTALPSILRSNQQNIARTMQQPY
ncbi:MAG: FtsX-like permease family protein [Candidatus Heimdallarchaeota archaeon]|nr:FtsX-like permease family protein [Candidatus Heimdallarchaeota archaeon]